MNLLPKSHQDFSQKEYWNTFFKKRGKKAFEWYGEYPELCGQIHKYVKPKDEVLMVGCGNSTLSSDLYDVGYKQITNIDISQVAIKQMKNSNKEQRPDMEFIHMDALNMSFEDGRFSVVLDKGTLDALMPDDSEEVSQRIDKFFSEIGRVLRLGGRYICISLLQDHILRKLLESFANKNWMFRIVRCHEAEQKTADSGESTVMPVFAVIITKFKALPQLILEICMGGEKMQRLTSTNEIIDMVRSAQDAALVTNGLTNNSLVGLNEVYLDLMKPGENTPRYTVHVLDQKGTRRSGKFAAFIVPLGREADWLFSTPEGRKKLLQSAGFNRLAVVSMHREQIYDSLDSVKDELSPSVKSLSPKGLTGPIPYLSLGSDVGKRDIVYKGFSDISGDFVVEDVVGGVENSFRRLIFLKSPFLIQSEAKLRAVTRSLKGEIKMMIDPGHLACAHHVFMTVGVQLALQNLEDRDTLAKIAIVGLGGGGLCTFLHRCFKNLSINAVDIDPAILHVARQYFGLICDERLDVSIEDGIEFVKKSAQKGDKLDAILFDVDSKDTSIGMSCPPKQFLEKEVLENVKCCIGDKGFFILNLVCRDESLRKKVIEDLKLHFSHLASYKLPQEVNEVLFCTNLKSISQWPEELETASKVVNSNAIESKLQYEEVVDISSLLETLQLFNSTHNN